MWNPRWRQDGQDPDYRFSLANERTFLAWIRTALALMAGGVALVQFATRLQPHLLIAAVATGLALLSAVLCTMAYQRWRDNEIAMRHGRSLPLTWGVPLLAATLALLGLALAVMVAVS